MELGEVLGRLLDPPPLGRALVRLQQPGRASVAQVAWAAGRGERPDRWMWRADEVAHLCDGQTYRVYEGRRLAEQVPARAGRWYGHLHLFAPLQGRYWGRRHDDWRMRDSVEVDGDLVTVRLEPLVDADPAFLRLDLSTRLVTGFDWDDRALRVVDFVAGPPELSFAAPADPVDDAAFMDEVRPLPRSPGTVRWAG